MTAHQCDENGAINVDRHDNKGAQLKKQLMELRAVRLNLENLFVNGRCYAFATSEENTLEFLFSKAATDKETKSQILTSRG